MVPAHARRGFGLVARPGLAATLIVAVAVGCGASSEGRRLPGDRSTPLLYVALGDSTVEGVGASRPAHTYVSRIHARLQNLFPAARMANLGVSGARSADVLSGQLPRAVALGPHLVTLSIGPNDITGGVPLAEFERNIEAILGTLARETRAVIVVSLLPDLAVTRRFRSSQARAEVARQTARFNEVLADRAREHGAELVDLYRPSRDEVPGRPELLADDGYHPSDIGYARWAELMWHGIQRRLAPRPTS